MLLIPYILYIVTYSGADCPINASYNFFKKRSQAYLRITAITHRAGKRLAVPITVVLFQFRLQVSVNIASNLSSYSHITHLSPFDRIRVVPVDIIARHNSPGQLDK